MRTPRQSMEEKPKVEKPKPLDVSKEAAALKEAAEKENVGANDEAANNLEVPPTPSSVASAPKSPMEPGKAFPANLSVSALRKQAQYSAGKPSRHDKA